MKNISKAGLILFCLTLLSPILWGQRSSQEQKQLNKAIRKTWDIDIPEISLVDSNLISENNMHLNGEIYIVKENANAIGYAYVGRVFSCRAGGCSAKPETKNDDDYEYFDYLILLNLDISIDLVRVFNYQATHGQEVCSPAWLKQFKGYNGNKELDYGKEIDAISGATISAISIIIDIQNVARSIEESLATTSKSEI